MSEDGGPGAWDSAPVALLRLTQDGTVEEANPTLLDWLGRDRPDVVGRVRLSALLTVGGRIYWETHLAPLLHMQGRVDEVAVELRGAEGRLPALMSAVVRPDGGVDVALFGAAERARYERELLAARVAAERSADRLRVLQQGTSDLSRAVDVEQVGRALLVTAMDRLGARAAAFWVTDDDGRMRPRGRRGRLEPPSPPVGLEGAGDAVLPADHGGLLVPLVAPGGGPRGALWLMPSRDPGADPVDVDVLTALGRQAGTALERALLHDRSVSVAHELQHALLLLNLPFDDRFALSTAYRPGEQAMEVGGDWYDAFMLDTDRLAVVVGDVVGRGLRAATSMGQLRSAVRACAAPDADPAVVVERTDRFVRQTGVGFMTTMVYADLDLRSGRLRWACAGHLPPLRVADAARVPEYLWGGRSAPLGVVSPGASRDQDEADLSRGGALVLYTDGLVERRDRALQVGLDRLADAAAAVVNRRGPGATGGEPTAAGGYTTGGSGTASPGATVAGFAPQDADEVVRMLVGAGDERDDVCVLALTYLAG